MPISNRTCFLVNLRDGLACQRCGRLPASREHYHHGFEYHHRTHRAAGGSDDADNIVLVCHPCHRSHHDGRDDLDTLPQHPTPIGLTCHRCGHSLDAQHVESNCGWYHCDGCHERVHLFDHFDLQERKMPT